MYADREGIYWYPDFPILLLSIHVYDEFDILSIIKFKNKKCLGMVHQKDLGIEFATCIGVCLSVGDMSLDIKLICNCMFSFPVCHSLHDRGPCTKIFCNE